MSRAARRVLFALLVLAFLLHNDLWLWNDARRFAGLPAGLLYHVLFCLAVALLMAFVTARRAPTE